MLARKKKRVQVQHVSPARRQENSSPQEPQEASAQLRSHSFHGGQSTVTPQGSDLSPLLCLQSPWMTSSIPRASKQSLWCLLNGSASPGPSAELEVCTLTCSLTQTHVSAFRPGLLCSSPAFCLTEGPPCPPCRLSVRNLGLICKSSWFHGLLILPSFISPEPSPSPPVPPRMWLLPLPTWIAATAF